MEGGRFEMSEYQYYEFQAIDRPLTREQLAEVRSISTRAEITPTRFTNEYDFGNFRGDPIDFVERFYDAHVYTANWGTRTLMFGMPETAVNVEALQAYQVDDDGFSVQTRGGRAIVTIEFRNEGGDSWFDFDDGTGWMSELVGLRADLMDGDLRAAYLGWLRGLQTMGPEYAVEDAADAEDDEEYEPNWPEPPVPPGLKSLTGSLEALARFLDLDQDLLAVAAEASPPMTRTGLTDDALRSWIAELPRDERDAILFRLIHGETGLAAELRRRARAATTPDENGTSPSGRTLGELWSAAETRTSERKQREAEAARQERVRRMEEATRAREAHLRSLIGQEGALWHQIETGVRTKKPKEYDRAVEILRDLRDLAEREGKTSELTTRLSALRDTHGSKPSFIARLDKARLT
jgi:hypothetical protein